MRGVDWARVDVLVPVDGGIGGKGSFLGFKWDGWYLIALEGGGVVGLVRNTLDVFAGPEAGLLWMTGRGYLSLGALVGYALIGQSHAGTAGSSGDHINGWVHDRIVR